MTSQWHITRDTFAPFDPDRELDDVLARIKSPKIALVLGYWNSLRRGARSPAHADIDPSEIKRALPNIMIAGISDHPFRVLYRLVGTEIVLWSRTDFTNRYADELVFEGDARDFTDYYRIVVEARRPAHGISDWAEPGRSPQWVETVICPLSQDGTTIDRCLALEDYEPMYALDIEALPPVRRRSS